MKVPEKGEEGREVPRLKWDGSECRASCDWSDFASSLVDRGRQCWSVFTYNINMTVISPLWDIICRVC